MSGSQPGATAIPESGGAEPAGTESVGAELVGSAPVLVIGVGLLGTSVALSLRHQGCEVWLSDTDAQQVRTASGLGAGVAAPGNLDQVGLVVVAVPPQSTAVTVLGALRESPAAVVTDVASVKAPVLATIEADASAGDLARYVGSHPMAGSERSGPLAANRSLFQGRPWAVCPHPHASRQAIDVVRRLAIGCGANVVEMDVVEHDVAVARTSHVPQILSVVTAAQLTDADPEHLQLSGQGLRDVTRIAGSDPQLWTQIIGANRGPLEDLLISVESRIAQLREALGDPERLGELLARGVAGRATIPGKHGGPALHTQSVVVVVPDQPGVLARLFGEVSSLGANIEDLYIDHDPARPYGLVDMRVATSRAAQLVEELTVQGWEIRQ